MSALNIFMLTTAGLNLLVGIFVFLKKVRGLIHQSFLLFCIGSSLWTVSYVLLVHTHILVYDRFIILGSLIATAAIFLFSKYFPIATGHSFSRKDGLSLLPLILCSTLLLDTHIISSVTFVGSLPVPEYGRFFVFFALCIFCYLALSIYYLTRNFKKANPIEQNRLLVFTFSLIIFVLVCVIFDLILPAFGNPKMNYLGPLSLTLFVCASAYTLIAKRLLDITIILQKTFIYTMLLLTVSALYYVIVTIIHWYLVQFFDIAFDTRFLGIAIVALSIPAIDSKLRKISDGWLGVDRINYTNSLLSIVREISQSGTLEDTIERVTRSINHTMKAQETRIVIAQLNCSPAHEEVVFSFNHTGVYIPMVFHQQYVATISVRNKRSGKVFTHRDVDFLQTISIYLCTHLRILRLLRDEQQYTQTLQGEIQETQQVTQQLQEDQNNMIVDIAHNLQTPLTILKGELHSLQNHQFTRRDLQRLDMTVDRLSQFVTRLLQAGNNIQQPMYMELFNLSELVLDICEYTQTVAESQHIQLKYSITEQISLYGSQTDIRDAIVNVLSNAMKYMKKEGNRTIDLQLHTSKEGIVVIISDTGIGIKAQHLPYIFKPWYQGSAIQQGSGLGLSITHDIIQKHGGTITVSSTEGEGTIFTIILPQQKQDS